MIWLIGMGVLFLLLCLWFCIEQHLLRVRKQTIMLKRLPSEWSGLKLLQITDLHHRRMGKHNCRIVQKAQILKPDCIVITGDLISRDIRNFDEISCFLKQLREISPVYLCPGNHELDLPQSIWESLLKAVQQSGCRFLLDETIQLQKNTSCNSIYLTGAQLVYGVYRDENRKFRHLQQYTAADLEQALGSPQGCTILLAHNPFLMESYVEWGADLVLCGHVHGGLVRLPLVGGLLSPERKFFPEYDKGRYQKKNTQMYVSGGIGKPRLFNPPEINLLYLNSVQK